MTPKIRSALYVLAAVALGLAFVSGYAFAPSRTRSVSARPGLAYRASVAIQASFNTQETTLGIPIRIVGRARCHTTKQFSPTSASVVCSTHALGPHNSATGGCAQIVGVYYDKLALFAESHWVNEPCPDGEQAR